MNFNKQIYWMKKKKYSKPNFSDIFLYKSSIDTQPYKLKDKKLSVSLESDEKILCHHQKMVK